MLLLFLLAVLAMHDVIRSMIARPFINGSNRIPEAIDWTPDPANDYAPRHGYDDHCDGYSRQQWAMLTAERGIQISRKAKLKAAWDADPEREKFPQRYQDWGHRPYIGQIMDDLTALYW